MFVYLVGIEAFKEKKKTKQIVCTVLAKIDEKWVTERSVIWWTIINMEEKKKYIQCQMKVTLEWTFRST